MIQFESWRQVQSGIVDVVPNTLTDAATHKRKGKAKMRVWHTTPQNKNTKLFYGGHFISLHREDINNPLHLNLWADLCKGLGFDPEATNALDLKVVKATVTDFSE